LDLWIVCAIVALALVFDFVNGFHDAANSIATVVSTRVLSPRWAVLWAAFFNFIAFLFFGLHVAGTIKGVVDPACVTIPIIAAGLVGAIVWDLVTWYYGIPMSSSHALIGGFAGAAVVAAGFQVLVLGKLFQIVLFIFVAPLLGMAMGFAFMSLIHILFRKSSPARVGHLFQKLQLCSAAAYSLGHGGNDAQKTMGIIAVVLIASDRLGVKDEIPLWVVLACHTAMALGTLCGGWRIVKTMGQRICNLKPVQGFAAETAGTVCLFGATWMGIPVSTTHTITGSIFGVGATRGVRSVRWSVAERVAWAWVLTIPAAALLAIVTYYAFNLLGWSGGPPPPRPEAAG
jgi:PiT family inorganic phosphate transporter